MKKIFLIILLFFFAACDGKIYNQVHDKSQIGAKIRNIEIIASDEFSLKASKNFLIKKGFKIEKSDYILRVEYRDYKKTCTNPLSKTSSDYSYDGLVSITLFYKNSKVHSSYRDFKGDVKENLFTPLINSMISDLEISF
ncbi:MAG: hypothetical protein A2513_03175 [Sulfurimonas sp. RIFOXYD12_FULL_33_39]|uniref:hypothetical protein n=1 Tax=unclassified Sulfurimonas TaxID=2623549 RepID=UPI0008D1777B|nr:MULTISPECIES: hypothetical protein [unclassified Sulfurimonas]OHE08993.1 MAG: hypothetical protein A2513_03175 [Sulfurimonas sp. RIFOXYD12_FULL_33_39]OHE14303.1 MAG: hypothetical protein A2530_06475 [Sulfurimonas sp. RIFOXYD2_FULL_34_21]